MGVDRDVAGASRARRVTAVYSLSHFVVDLSCITTVLGWASATLGGLGVGAVILTAMAYDLIAFGLQLPFGALTDLLGRVHARTVTIVSLALIACGVGVSLVGEPLCAGLAVLLVGVGNAFFHCVGGTEVVGETRGRTGPAGIFTSAGTSGVFIGGIAGFQTWEFTSVLLLALLGAAILAVALLGRSSEERLVPRLPSAPSARMALVLIALSIGLRIYASLVLDFSWKEGLVLSATVIAMVVAGKATGGFVSDRIGPFRAQEIAHVGAAALFLLAWDVPAAGLAASFLLMMPMGITLLEIVRLLPLSLGLSFGIFECSTLLGAIPFLAGVRYTSPWLLSVLSLVLLVLLEVAMRLSRASSEA